MLVFFMDRSINKCFYLFVFIHKMIITELQLKIQERSDKDLSFWSIVFDNWKYWVICHVDVDWYYHLSHYFWNSAGVGHIEECDNIGHPMTYWRLCYLYESIDSIKDKSVAEYPWLKVRVAMGKEPVSYGKTVLERPEEIQNLVLLFLQSLPKWKYEK